MLMSSRWYAVKKHQIFRELHHMSKLEDQWKQESKTLQLHAQEGKFETRKPFERKLNFVFNVSDLEIKSKNKGSLVHKDPFLSTISTFFLYWFKDNNAIQTVITSDVCFSKI